MLGLLGVDPSFDAALRLFREFPIWRISLAGAVATGFCIVGLLQKPAARWPRRWPRARWR